MTVGSFLLRGDVLTPPLRGDWVRVLRGEGEGEEEVRLGEVLEGASFVIVADGVFVADGVVVAAGVLAPAGLAVAGPVAT